MAETAYNIGVRLLNQNAVDKTKAAASWFSKAYQLLGASANSAAAVSGGLLSDRGGGANQQQPSAAVSAASGSKLRSTILRCLAWAEHLLQEHEQAQRAVDLLLAEDDTPLHRCLALELICQRPAAVSSKAVVQGALL